MLLAELIAAFTLMLGPQMGISVAIAVWIAYIYGGVVIH